MSSTTTPSQASVSSHSSPPISTTTGSTTTTDPAPSSSTDPHPSSTSFPRSNERQINEARAVLTASMQNIGTRLTQDLTTRAQTLHANTAALSKQEANLATATRSLTKDTARLGAIADKGLKSLKEFGDLEHFHLVMGRELDVLEETMRLVGQGEGNWSDDDDDDGDSSGSGEGFEPCRICRVDKGEVGEERIVLCDGLRGGRTCDGPYHWDCLGLTQMPQGLWVCPECRRAGALARRPLGGAAKAWVGMGSEGEGEDGDVVMGGMEVEYAGVASALAFDTPAVLQQRDGTWT